MPFKPVDAAIKVIVGPAIDDSDFKAREETLAFNQAGMEVDVILEKYDGTIVTTAVTPTAAGDYDWAHTDQGFYELELPASGGASFNNTEEGIITVAVFCTGVLPFRSVSYDIIESQAYDALVKGTDNLQVDTVQIEGADPTDTIRDSVVDDANRIDASALNVLSGHDPGANIAKAGDLMGLVADAITAAKIADNAITSDQLAASACTKIINDFETQSAADPTGFKVNVMEINGTAQTANDNGADINTLIDRITAARAGYLDNLNGHTAQTGDSFARIGATGSGLTTLAQALVCSEARLAELDAANIPSDAANAQVASGANFVILSSAVHGNAALKALIDGVPTTAEFNARTLLAANYFEFGVDNVIVGTNNDKTGYALSNVGADLILKTSTFALAMADATWDEILTGATHNIATSAGRRVRELGAYHITSGTAQGGATHSITLAAADTAADHIYNRNLIVILAGTGKGQTRTIVDFANGTKVAVVDRDWWITPDATSEYTIIPDDTPLVTDHGVATAGTNNTITIRASASATSSTYSNDIILIMAGTGIGQSRLISTYNGGTKVITVCENWTTNPDNTSVYVILPYGHAHVCAIGVTPLADIKTQVDDALTDVHLDDLIQLALTVNDAGPNAANFITSSAVAIDNWYNQNMLLFTSGALAGLARVIDDYDGATKRVYLTEAFPQAPANGNQFIIVGIAGSTTTPVMIADAVWDELEAGHTIAGSYGEEVTKQGKKLDRNFVWELIQQPK